MENRIHLSLLVFLLTSFLYFVSLSTYPLMEPDEARNMEIAREIVMEGRAFPPTVHGRVRYEKPPLYYYILSVFYKVFGHNEYAGRVLSAMSSVLIGIGILILAKYILGTENEFIPSVIFLTNIPILIYGRIASMEPFLTFLTFYSILLFLLYEKYKKFIYLVLSFIFVSLSFCVKGPIGLFYYLVFILSYKFVFGFKFDKKFLLFPVIFFIIVFPLFYIQEMNYSGYIYNFFVKENIIRYTSDVFRRNKTFCYFIVFVPLSFGVWLLFVKDIVMSYISFKMNNKDFLYVFLIFILVPIIVFSFSKSKMLHYVFPVFPFVSSIMAYDFDLNRFMKFLLPYLLFLYFIFIIVFPIYFKYQYNMKDKLLLIVKNVDSNVVYYGNEFYSISFYLNKTPYVSGNLNDLVNVMKDFKHGTIFIDIDDEKEVFSALKFCNLKKVLTFRIRGHTVVMINADCL
ncbi:MAG: ArnT family glycosyltransferase [Thermosulfidibacteraceae bacterium]